jgi:hypothetical protein
MQAIARHFRDVARIMGFRRRGSQRVLVRIPPSAR